MRAFRIYYKSNAVEQPAPSVVVFLCIVIVPSVLSKNSIPISSGFQIFLSFTNKDNTKPLSNSFEPVFTNMCSVSESTTIGVKLILEREGQGNPDIRRVRLNTQGWGDLWSRVFKLWPSLGGANDVASGSEVSSDDERSEVVRRLYRVCYVDNEGDMITVSSDSEWRECVRLFRSASQEGTADGETLKLWLRPRVRSGNAISGVESSKQEAAQAVGGPCGRSAGAEMRCAAKEAARAEREARKLERWEANQQRRAEKHQFLEAKKEKLRQKWAERQRQQKAHASGEGVTAVEDGELCAEVLQDVMVSKYVVERRKACSDTWELYGELVVRSDSKVMFNDRVVKAAWTESGKLEFMYSKLEESNGGRDHHAHEHHQDPAAHDHLHLHPHAHHHHHHHPHAFGYGHGFHMHRAYHHHHHDHDHIAVRFTNESEGEGQCESRGSEPHQYQLRLVKVDEQVVQERKATQADGRAVMEALRQLMSELGIGCHGRGMFWRGGMRHHRGGHDVNLRCILGVSHKIVMRLFELHNARRGQADAKEPLQKAVEVLQLVTTVACDQDSATLYNLACAYSLLGSAEELVKSAEAFRRALDSGYDNVEHARKDADLENLRKSGMFDEVLSSQVGVEGKSTMKESTPSSVETTKDVGEAACGGEQACEVKAPMTSGAACAAGDRATDGCTVLATCVVSDSLGTTDDKTCSKPEATCGETKETGAASHADVPPAIVDKSVGTFSNEVALLQGMFPSMDLETLRSALIAHNGDVRMVAALVCDQMFA